MEKQVLVHVSGLHMMEGDGQEEPVEIVVPGEHYFRNGSHDPVTYSRMPRHSCCEVRVMQLHDILLLRTSAILPEAISAGGGLTPS